MKHSFPKASFHFARKIFFGFFFLFSLCVWLSSCEALTTEQAEKLSNDPLVTEIIDGVGELTTELKERSLPNRVQVWVDNLILKAQPGKEMPQIGLLRQGQTLEYLYQRTALKSEFTLRGQKYYEPWILIKTDEGLMGWVHQGGVRFVEPNFMDWLTTGSPMDPTARTRSVTNSVNPRQEWLIVPGKQVGSITVNTSEEDLMRSYGRGFVQRGTVANSNESTESCTILMGGTPDELRITWKDDNKKKVKAVYLLHADSKWRTSHDLRVGIPILELTKINQAPIDFYGFDWEYGGTVQDWKKGKLARLDKYFYVALTPNNARAVKDQIKDFKGNRVFSSNTEGVRALNLVVGKLVVYLD